jgi:hypothetical protein
MTILCRVLMLYPKFIPNSFWNYTEACELVGAKYPPPTRPDHGRRHAAEALGRPSRQP